MQDANRTTRIANLTWASLGINLILSVLKFIAGVLGHSQAVVADSVHSFSDSFTDVAVLWGARYWDKPPDSEHPHGHKRLEIVLALVIAISLFAVAIGMMYSSLSELKKDHDNIIGLIAGIAAFVSIVVKELLYRWTMKYARDLHSQVLAANAWHHRSDGLSSIPVMITSVIAYFWPNWAFLDHIGSVVVSIFIVIAAYRIGRPAFNLLIDAGASSVIMAKLKMITATTEGVIEVHKLRTRYIGSSSIAVDMHVVVNGSLTVRQGHDIAEAVEARIEKDVPQAVDVVVHIEPN